MGNMLQEWHNLVARIANVRLQVGSDLILWPLKKNPIFVVKSVYQVLVSSGIKVTQEN